MHGWQPSPGVYPARQRQSSGCVDAASEVLKAGHTEHGKKVLARFLNVPGTQGVHAGPVYPASQTHDVVSPVTRLTICSAQLLTLEPRASELERSCTANVARAIKMTVTRVLTVPRVSSNVCDLNRLLSLGSVGCDGFYEHNCYCSANGNFVIPLCGVARMY